MLVVFLCQIVFGRNENERMEGEFRESFAIYHSSATAMINRSLRSISVRVFEVALRVKNSVYHRWWPLGDRVWIFAKIGENRDIFLSVDLDEMDIEGKCTWFFNFFTLNIIWNKKSFAIFHPIFGNFPILQKNCLLLFSKFFRKDAKLTRYFMYNEGESCLIWTIHLSSTLLCSHNRKFGKTTRDLPYDKIHRLDTSIINKISQMRKQQICKNKRIGTNWTIGC